MDTRPAVIFITSFTSDDSCFYIDDNLELLVPPTDWEKMVAVTGYVSIFGTGLGDLSGLRGIGDYLEIHQTNASTMQSLASLVGVEGFF